MSPYPIPCVSRKGSDEVGGGAAGLGGIGMGGREKFTDRGEDDWVRDINTLLKFNASFGGRGTLSGNGGFEEEE